MRNLFVFKNKEANITNDGKIRREKIEGFYDFVQMIAVTQNEINVCTFTYNHKKSEKINQQINYILDACKFVYSLF